MIEFKTKRLNQLLSHEELSDLSGVAICRIRVAKKGIQVLSEREAKRIAKIFGYVEIPDFLSSLIDEGRENDF